MKRTNFGGFQVVVLIFKHGASEYIQRLGNMMANETGDFLLVGVYQPFGGSVSGSGCWLWGGQLFCLSSALKHTTPKDGRENEIQFALEQGIGSMIYALSTKQLPYPANPFEKGSIV